MLPTSREGMNEQTTVTGWADGASNCWSVLKSLRIHCQDGNVLDMVMD